MKCESSVEQFARKQTGENYLLISYNTEFLRDICFHTPTAIQYLGEEAATALQARHSDIQAASNVFELPVGKISVEENMCTLRQKDLLQLLLRPNYATNDVEIVDWSTVGRIRLMGINDVE